MSKYVMPPRQKMINLIYIILIAILAIHISKDAIEGYDIISNDYRPQIAQLQTYNEELRVRLEQEKPEVTGQVQSVKEKTNAIRQELNDLKENIIRTADKDEYQSGWLWDDTPYSFQPYLSPLMLDKGVVTVTAFPGMQGDTARLECTPASSYYTLTNTTKTRAPSAGRFRVSRDWLENGNDITVSGNVDGKRTGTVNIYSSQDFFMHTFLERLRAKGIRCLPDYSFSEFQKDSVSVRMASYKTSVQAVVNQIMKESDNLNAEAMLCRLGAQFTGGRHISAEDGLSAIRRLIKKLGYVPDRYNLADGCGLSNYNYISSELLVAFLKFAYSRTDVFQKLYKALPIGGVDGTLKNRMKKGTPSYKKVHAKTGSFTAINCLAGYLKADNGHQIAFAIMNQNVLSGREARKFQDTVCDILIR